VLTDRSDTVATVGDSDTITTAQSTASSDILVTISSIISGVTYVASFTSHYESPTSISASAPVDATTSAAISSAIPNADDTKGGNAGVIAGGAVGGVAALLFVGAGLFLLRRRRRHRLNKGPQGSVRSAWTKPELSAKDCQPHRGELQGSKVPEALLQKRDGLSELPANEEAPHIAPVELPSTSNPAETAASGSSSTLKSTQ
jgi:hypothetical protein